MSNSDPVLKVKDLRKNYYVSTGDVAVLNGVNMELKTGSFEAVMGPSGAGKSTLLHLLAGILSADSGEISIAGQSITGLSDEAVTKFRRRHIGLIFQDFNLIPTLTAEENVCLPLLLDRKNPDEYKLQKLLERLGLVARRKHFPNQLSGGERQRVAIARALVNDPAIVLADEPTGNLDSPAGRAFCELLQEVNRTTGSTILLVSHDPIVASAATWTHLMKDGVLVERFETKNDSALVAERYLASMSAS